MHFQLEPILVVYNSNSGTGDNTSEIQEKIEELKNRHDVTVVTVQELLNFQKSKATIQSKNVKKIVVIGGDGTVNAALKLAVEQKLQLSVIPNGTFNHFAKHLHLPLDIDSAFAVLSHSDTKKIDVGRVNEHYFINFCSVGFYAEVIAQRIRLQSIGGFKWSSFFKAFVQLFFNYKPIKLTFQKDSFETTKRTPLVFISNNEIEFGSVDILNKRTTFDTGLLQLIIIKDYNRFYFILLGFLSLFFDMRKYIGFETLQLTEFAIDAKNKKMSVAVDGEVFKLDCPIQFSSAHLALDMRVSSKE